MTKDEIVELFTKEFVEDIFQNEGSEDERFEQVFEEESMDNGKYQHFAIIIKDNQTNKHYRIKGNKSGSYFTDYDFNYSPGAQEVELKEVVIKKWFKV